MAKHVMVCGTMMVALAAAQTSGSIKGAVVDEVGHPVAGARVLVDDLRLKLKVRPRTVLTNSDGSFQIDGLDWDTYTINVEKAEDGYPDSTSGFYSGSPSRQVSVSAQMPVAVVSLGTGPQAGHLAPVQVLDAVTGQPVTTATIKMSRGRPAQSGQVACGYAMLISAVFSRARLVPANVPIRMLVSAPGYSDWYFPGTPDVNAAQPIVFRPGEERTFTAILQPKLVP